MTSGDTKQKDAVQRSNRIEIDWTQLDAYLQFKASKRLCAELMGVSEDTIERRIAEKTGETFTQYADRKLDITRLKLQQKAIQKALSGDNTCIIFCLKNICGWSDRQVLEASISGNANLALVDALQKYKANN